MKTLDTFTKKLVSPGEPLTAQAWNDLLSAVDTVYKYIQAASSTLKVKITNPEVDLLAVRAIAIDTDGTPFEAVPPLTEDAEHTFVGLRPGGYTVIADAPGYALAHTQIVVPDKKQIDMALQPNAVTMPDLFGTPLAAAREQLRQAGINLARVFDFNGREVLPNAPTPEDDASRVLVTWPAANTPLAPSGAARLVIASPIKVDPAVAVPNIIGMTEAEAKHALESVGLTVGQTQYMTKRTS